MTDYLEPIDFGSCLLQEVPVVVEGKNYVLKEATGSAATAWRNAKAESIKLRNGKPVGFSKGPTDSDPFLVSLCLFNSEGNLVPKETILSWPDRIQKTLFERLKQISDLSEADDTLEGLKQRQKELDEQIEVIEETVKNDSDSLEDGSS